MNIMRRYKRRKKIAAEYELRGVWCENRGIRITTAKLCMWLVEVKGCHRFELPMSS